MMWRCARNLFRRRCNARPARRISYCVAIDNNCQLPGASAAAARAQHVSRRRPILQVPLSIPFALPHIYSLLQRPWPRGRGPPPRRLFPALSLFFWPMHKRFAAQPPESLLYMTSRLGPPTASAGRHTCPCQHRSVPALASVALCGFLRGCHLARKPRRPPLYILVGAAQTALAWCNSQARPAGGFARCQWRRYTS